MTSTTSKPVLVGLTALLLSGCAGSSDRYPSLAIRDSERVAGQFTPVAPEQPSVPPVASAEEVSGIVAEAAEAHRQFVANEPGARRLVDAARGTGIESNARSLALVALADLTSLRGQTSIALASLDDLETRAAATFAPLAAIRTAQAEVEILVTQQDAAIDSLGAGLDQ
ncbi:MAG: hypothetical protein ACX930_04780 [Erythrobacter sp.]